jgi:hypothetical protein
MEGLSLLYVDVKLRPTDNYCTYEVLFFTKKVQFFSKSLSLKHYRLRVSTIIFFTKSGSGVAEQMLKTAVVVWCTGTVCT